MYAAGSSYSSRFLHENALNRIVPAAIKLDAPATNSRRDIDSLSFTFKIPLQRLLNKHTSRTISLQSHNVAGLRRFGGGNDQVHHVA